MEHKYIDDPWKCATCGVAARHTMHRKGNDTCIPCQIQAGKDDLAKLAGYTSTNGDRLTAVPG